MGEILLISADWQLRVLVRAQLLAEGFNVRAWPTLRSAIVYLVRSGEQPRLTILDAQSIEIEVQTLADLWRLTEEAPLILCGGILSQAVLGQAGLPPLAAVLLRPFRVGDLVKEVEKVLACLEEVPIAE